MYVRMFTSFVSAQHLCGLILVVLGSIREVGVHELVQVHLLTQERLLFILCSLFQVVDLLGENVLHSLRVHLLRDLLVLALQRMIDSEQFIVLVLLLPVISNHA